MLSLPITKTKKIILSLFALCLLTTLIVIITLFILGPDFLVVESNPEPADAIILLSSAEDRMEKAVELYQEGLADTVILTNSTETWTTVEKAVSLGIPQSALIEEPRATSTYENALFSKEVMNNHHLESAIVVTSDYHSRRTRYTFEQVFDRDIELTYAFSTSFFEPENGLTERENRTVFSEYVKLIAYWFRFLFI